LVWRILIRGTRITEIVILSTIETVIFVQPRMGRVKQIRTYVRIAQLELKAYVDAKLKVFLWEGFRCVSCIWV
jgi:hypothetical protein